MNFFAYAEPWFGTAFLVLFPVGWCFVLWVLSWLGGWRRLAQLYPVAERPAGATFYFVTGESSNAYYRGSLILTVAPEGVHLAALFLFRPFHSPLLLPWSGMALETRKIWFATRAVLVFKDTQTTLEIYLPGGGREAVRIAAGARFADIDRPPPLAPRSR